MIVECPECSARFRLDVNRSRSGKRLTLKCARCRKTFRIDVPVPEALAVELEVVQPIRVLVAHSDPQMCATVKTLLGEAGIVCEVCSEGTQALSLMEKAPPHVALMDVALPGLYAFEAVEKIRNKPGLGSVKIILISSVYNKTAYKRTPASLYGADDYIEKHHIPGDLVDKVKNLVSGTTPLFAPGADSADERDGDSSDGTRTSTIEKIKSKIHKLEDGGISGDDEEKAKRLARIIVSDIALYNQKKVDDGIRTGKFFEILAPEIEEGKRLFADRFQGRELHGQDFLHQAFSSLIESRKKELQS